MAQNKRPIYFGIALLLLGLAAFLSSRPGSDPSESVHASFSNQKINYPRQTRSRQARPLPQASIPAPSQQKRAEAQINALEKAIDASDANPFVFVEFNGLQHNPLAESLLTCHQETVDRTVAETLERFGIDLKRDVDRLAFAPDLFAVSGFFQDFDVSEASTDGASLDVESQSANSEIFSTPQGAYLGRVGSNMLLMSRNKETIVAAIERAEGNRPVGAPPRFDGVGGDLYGQISGQWLQPLQQMISMYANEESFQGDLIKRALVRSFVEDHIAISADLQVQDTNQTAEILSMARAAVSAARFDAVRSGNQQAAMILDKINLHQTSRGQIGIDAALPKELVLSLFGCPKSSIDAGQAE